MTKLIIYKRLSSILTGTLLVLGLLMPIPHSRAQDPDEPVQSRSGHFKIQNVRERVQNGSQRVAAPRVERVKPSAGSIEVLQRAKLGNYIEDLDFIPNGPFADHIVMTAGYEVYGVPADANSDRAVRKLFDLRRLGIETAPRGIAYITSEHLFAFVDPDQPTMLFICDHKGEPLTPRTIKYLNGYLPFIVEGLAYLPPTSPQFPDHLVLVTSTDFINFRLEVMRRDGQVVAEIPVPAEVYAGIGYVASVAFAEPDHLLVGTLGEIWALDFAGNIVSGPVVTNTELQTDEGLVQTRDGRIVVSNGAQLRFYDAALNRLPQDDRYAGTGVHLITTAGAQVSGAWDSDTNQHLILAPTEESAGAARTMQVAAVPPSLDSATRLFDFLALNTFFRVRAVTYLPDEHLIAVAMARIGSRPREIVLYDHAGAVVERINIAAIGAPGSAFTYIPTTREFAVRVATSPSKLKILTRAGTLAREIDLSPTGLNFIGAVAYFNPSHPSGGQFLIAGSPFFGDGTRAIVTDFNGNLISEFDYRDALGLLDVAGLSPITTGPQAGAFSAIDQDGSEIVVFRLGATGE